MQVYQKFTVLEEFHKNENLVGSDFIFIEPQSFVVNDTQVDLLFSDFFLLERNNKVIQFCSFSEKRAKQQSVIFLLLNLVSNQSIQFDITSYFQNKVDRNIVERAEEILKTIFILLDGVEYTDDKDDFQNPFVEKS